MHINTTTGLIETATVINSPNNDKRPADTPPDLIVVHNISLPPGEFGGQWIDDLFTNSLDPAAHPYFATIHERKVSSHLLITREGEVKQYVPFHRRAWHAGKSNYCGRERCNDFSIGIELEGCDDQPFTEDQYQQLSVVIQSLINSYPTLTAKHITGHSDIAPGRKTDPGPCFDWDKLHKLLGNADQPV